MPKYTTLLFDADQTLLDFKRSEHEAVIDCLEFFGITPNSEVVQKYSEINAGFWKMLERGEIEKSKLYAARWQAFADYYGYNLDAQKMSEKYLDTLSRKAYMIDGADKMCEKLSQYCRLYIITNGNKMVQDRRLANTSIKKYFSGVFISEEIGYEKPRIEYFDKVRAMIPDFCNEDSLVIGDSLSSDIAGGIGAGIDTCWYNPENKSAPASMDITYTVSSFSEIEDIIL